MKQLFVIDAVNFLFRMYYAIGPMTNTKGQSTSALYGFIRAVQKLFKDFSPAHAVCVFDGPDNKKSRREVYADYKMHRKGAPEDLFPQFELAYEYCELAGIPTLCIDGVEADDTMASVARWAKKKDTTVYLCSSDKDLMQLVDEKTFLLQTHKDNLIIDAKKVEESFGVRPDQMLDLLAIMGDASDNIPGIEGFGPKTAAALLQEFGTLDELLAHPEKVKGEKKQQALREQKEVALMSRTLATLHDVDVPLEEEFYQLKAPNQELLFEFFHEQKFTSLMKSEPKVHVGEVQYHLIDSEEEFFTFLSNQKQICIDTETDGKHPMMAQLVGIGFSYEPGEAWYLPYKGQKALHDYFDRTDAAFYGHNIKYDWHILKNIGIELKSICFDTLLASYLLDPQNRKHNLDELALEKFKKVKIPIIDLIGKGKEVRTMFEVPIEQVKEYCCEDADYTCRLKELFEVELKEKRLISLFNDIELPLLTILAEMERTGIYLDVEEMGQLAAKLNRDVEALKRQIFEVVGEEFNLNSPKQLAYILFDQLAIPSKTRTTAADVLEELAPDYPVIQQILDYRGVEKLRSTYAEALPEAVNPKTGRIHCSFNQFVAATGRLSCQDPNLQNIPVRSTQGLAVRACFKPQKPDWSFIGADYSQIELRLLAHFSQDEELIKAFNAGEDIHAYTASLVFGVPLAAVEPEMRHQAKTVNFGILYGQGPFGLARQLGISQKDAAQFIKTYFERYPKVSAYLEHCREEVRKTGMAKTLTGRIRPIPDIHNQNPMIRAAAERLAINTPLQGTAADLIKMAMIGIDRKMREFQGKMILQIHDELIFEVPDGEIQEVKVLVKDQMENVAKLLVPIEVSIAVGKNWAEC
jgi:DNA polymerase-1